jgi:hypothetical protein
MTFFFLILPKFNLDRNVFIERTLKLCYYFRISYNCNGSLSVTFMILSVAE